MSDDELGAVFRFYIDGKVATSDSVTDPARRREQVGDIAATHGWLADECDERGRKWMVEVEFSDGEHVRWGTDVDGMVVPIEVGAAELLDAIARRWTDE